MSPTLLIADDSLTIQRVIKLAFAKEHLDVVAVSTGEQAIEQIEAHPPAIVLADTRMPDRNGYEIAEFVKSKADYNDIPVVLMTGAFEPVDDRRAQEAGCEAVLVKPFEPEKLVSTVRELLGTRAEPAGDASLTPSAPSPAPASPTPPTRPSGRGPLGEPELTWPVTDDLPPTPTAEPAAAAPARSASATTPSPKPSPATAEHPTVTASLVPEKKVSAPSAPPAPAQTPPTAEVATDTPPPLVITDELVDRLATRVIARLSDRVIRETTTEVVTEVAERLVSAEIQKIKDTLR